MQRSLQRARALVSSDEYERGLELTRAAITDAEALAWPPLTTRAAEGGASSRRGCVLSSRALAPGDADGARLEAEARRAAAASRAGGSRCADELAELTAFLEARRAVEASR